LGEQKLATRFNCDLNPHSEDCRNVIQDIDVEKYFVHDDYDAKRHLNDIALIKLAAPVDLRRKNIRTICLPTTEGLIKMKPQELIVTGWKKSDSEKLYQAHISRVDRAECSKRYQDSGIMFEIDESMICTDNYFAETCDSK
jgi:hypothetical protein